VEVRRQVDRASQGPVCVIIDSTGLKIGGPGEWHAQKHGEKRGKRWKKLHIGVDDQGQIVASTVIESNEQDPSQVLALLSQVDQPIHGFIGNRMYDQEPVYAAVEAHSPGARVIIPPRKDAALSPAASTAPTQRDQHLLEIEKAVDEFCTYIRNDAHLIPNYGERYRHGEPITTSLVESTVNQVVSKRFCKRHQMQWSKRGRTCCFNLG
jgi:hypothetical protein